MALSVLFKVRGRLETAPKSTDCSFKDLRLALSSQARPFIIIYNSTFRGSATFFWLP